MLNLLKENLINNNMKTQFIVHKISICSKYIYLSIKQNKIWYINIEYVLHVGVQEKNDWSKLSANYEWERNEKWEKWRHVC